MKAFFSKRHSEAIRQKKFPLKISKNLRISIERILSQHSNWGYEGNYTYDNAVETLKTFYGKETLEAFDEEDNRVPAYFPQIILKGYPSEVIDAIEAWFDQKPDEAYKCEKELNDILSIHNSQWRFINGNAILLNSEYLHHEIHAKTLNLFKECKALGALEEYQEAIQDLQSGDTKDAIVKAHKSVESAMKVALERDEHLTFGKLLELLIKANIIPHYYDEFFCHFEKLALGAVKERNRPGRGHGQGFDVEEVPKCLAEFAINLAGSINLFLIQRWIETHKNEIPEEKQQAEDESFNFPF